MVSAVLLAGTWLALRFAAYSRLEYSKAATISRHVPKGEHVQRALVGFVQCSLLEDARAFIPQASHAYCRSAAARGTYSTFPAARSWSLLLARMYPKVRGPLHPVTYARLGMLEINNTSPRVFQHIGEGPGGPVS